jgi:hypothetical protein
MEPADDKLATMQLFVAAQSHLLRDAVSLLNPYLTLVQDIGYLQEMASQNDVA